MFAVGCGMLALAVVLLAIVGRVADPPRWGVGVAGLALALAIVAYDAHYKEYPLSPLLMGACRMLVYLVAALAVDPQPGRELWLGASTLSCYLIGLTYAAKSEHVTGLDRGWPLQRC
jgi:4-hydroxybenzoate polyprenyltransferase